MAVSRSKEWSRVGRFISLVTLASLGCSVTAQFNPNSGNGNDGGSSTNGDKLTITFLNMTDSDAVDVEFYATQDDLTRLPDDLFDPERDYMIVRSIGVGGSGRLAPGQTDSIQLTCADGLTLGTMGGTFVDNETGDERGHGDERWLQEGPQFSCGATQSITFEYSGHGSTFATAVFIGEDNGQTARSIP